MTLYPTPHALRLASAMMACAANGLDETADDCIGIYYPPPDALVPLAGSLECALLALRLCGADAQRLEKGTFWISPAGTQADSVSITVREIAQAMRRRTAKRPNGIISEPTQSCAPPAETKPSPTRGR